LAREISDRRLRLGVVILDDSALPELLRTKQWIDGRNVESGISATLAWLKGQHEVGRLAGGRAPVYLPDYRPDNFVGREEHLSRLRATLVDERGVILVAGEPGSGNSTLALHFAWQVQKDFDAVIYLTCGRRPIDDISRELTRTLAEQLGHDTVRQSSSEMWRAAKEWLVHRQTLLILDDVWTGDTAWGTPGSQEQETDGHEMALRDLVLGPPVSILITSRRPALLELSPSRTITLDGFTHDEADAIFRTYLGPQLAERHTKALHEFVERVDRLPIAVVVGADLLRQQYGGIDQEARGLTLDRLRNDVHNVRDLLDRAISAQSEPARRLLNAAATCAQDGFWIPLAIEIGGLTADQGAAARDSLVNSSLLRVLNPERGRGRLHALVRV